MVDSVALIAETMQMDLAYLRTIGSNLANLNTAGYKREITAAQTVFNLDGDVPNTGAAIEAGLNFPRLRHARDLSQGALKPTDNPMNVAIEGDGFFVVADTNANSAGDNGGLLYTRKGEFTIDHTGRLALLSGERVQGSSGDITLDNSDFEIDAGGVVRQGGRDIDRLRVVSLNAAWSRDDFSAAYLGRGFFQAARQPAEADLKNYTVLQGYTEASNVDRLDEVVKMMEITRHFEASGNVLKAYDDILDTSINVVGQF